MATGNYGLKRIATVDITDVDMYYIYSPNRETLSNSNAIALDATQLLQPIKDTNGTQILGGMYSLKLPSNIFNNKGYYNILIRPKEIRTRITDCGVLSARPDVKGIVLDSNRTDVANFVNKFTNGGLVGYRIEYIDPLTQQKIPNFFRIVTSANRCEPVTENLSNTNQKAIRYRFNDTGSLVFLQLSPSSAPSVKPNAIPFIGDTNQEILIYNTFFDPIMVEIEMVDQTIETLSYGLFGPQTKSKDGDLTIYRPDNKEIYKQFTEFDILDQFGEVLHKVRVEKNVIDDSKDFTTITNLNP